MTENNTPEMQGSSPDVTGLAESLGRISLRESDRTLHDGIEAYEATRYNPRKVLQTCNAAGVEHYVITQDLLSNDIPNFGAGDKTRLKAATTFIFQLFCALRPDSTRPNIMRRARRLQDYCLDIGTAEESYFVIRADRVKALSENTELLSSLYQVGPVAMGFLSHYCSDLYADKPLKSV